MQEHKKIRVKRLGVMGTVELDLLPYYSAQDVLVRIGASEGMILTPAPQPGMVFEADQELWDQVQPGQTLYAVQGKGPC